METLAWGSVAESTQKNYWGKWKIWVEERSLQGKGPWLHELGDTDQVLEEVLEFMASRCFVHNNQQSTVRGYLAAIKYYHKMCTGWELPTSHCMIVAVGKGIDRAHGMTPKKSTGPLPLTWSILSQERRVVTTTVDEGDVMWLGLTLSYFLLCRASELWAYADGKVHLEFCLTRNSLTFLSGEERLSFENRARANAVQVRFRASKSDQKRQGCTITRTRVAGAALDAGSPAGAFEALLELLNVHPNSQGRPRSPSGARLYFGMFLPVRKR